MHIDGEKTKGKDQIENKLHLFDKLFSLIRICVDMGNLLIVVEARTLDFPLLVIPTVTASTIHNNLLVGMALMVTIIKTLNADNRIVLILALQAFECIGFLHQDLRAQATWCDLFPVVEDRAQKLKVVWGWSVIRHFFVLLAHFQELD